MKITKKKIIFVALELFFMGAVPIALVIWNYSNIGNSVQAVRFKIGITGVMLLIFIILSLKKIFLDKFKQKMQQQEAHLLSELKIETDAEKIKNIVRALKSIRTGECILSVIVPTIIFALLFVVCQALEEQIVKLSGVVGFIALSYLIGAIFSTFAAREVESKTVGGKKK